MDERTRERLFWTILVLEMLLFFGWSLSHLDGFQWSSDEGTYLMRVRLLQGGYRLYRDIWTDQLPGLIELLSLAFSAFGTSVGVGRSVIVGLTSIGLLGAALLVRQWGGRLGALFVSPILALSPNFLWLSRAMVSPDLPSISLGVAGMAAIGCYLRSYRRPWLVVSGLMFAAALYVKATALLALIPTVAWLLAATGALSSERRWTHVVPALWWGISIAAPLVLAISLHDLPGLWRQFVATQVASGQMELKIGPHALKIIDYLAQENWGLVALALAGTLVALRSRNRDAALLVFGWLDFSLLALLIRSPLWPSHHLVVLLFPLVVLAGIGFSSLARIREHGKIGVLGAFSVGATLVYSVSLPGTIAVDANLVGAQTFTSSLEAVDFLRARFPSGAVVISDYQMIPYRAGCTVPPELATLTKKRIQLGLLTSADLIRITQEWQPAAVILWDEQLIQAEEYVRWLKTQYGMAFKRGYHEIYLPVSDGWVQHPQDAQMGDSVRLRGYSLDQPAADPGGSLGVTLFWEVLASPGRSYSGFAHLVNADGRTIAQQDQLVGTEHYPSTLWQAGDLIVDEYRLRVPGDAVPGRYWLSVGLYDRETTARLAVVDAQGRRLDGDQLVLGAQPVVRWPAQLEAPEGLRSTYYRLGEVAQLVGYELEQSEATLGVRLSWEALQPTDWPDYVVFVHLRDAGGLVAQHDGVPGLGERPTLAWRRGEFVDDLHPVPLTGVNPGAYHLFVGMYDPATIQRLPVYDSSGLPLPASEVSLGVVGIGEDS